MDERTNLRPDLFWPKVDVRHPLGCWEWTGQYDGDINTYRRPDTGTRQCRQCERDRRGTA